MIYSPARRLLPEPTAQRTSRIPSNLLWNAYVACALDTRFQSRHPLRIILQGICGYDRHYFTSQLGCMTDLLKSIHNRMVSSQSLFEIRSSSHVQMWSPSKDILSLLFCLLGLCILSSFPDRNLSNINNQPQPLAYLRHIPEPNRQVLLRSCAQWSITS